MRSPYRHSDACSSSCWPVALTSFLFSPVSNPRHHLNPVFSPHPFCTSSGSEPRNEHSSQQLLEPLPGVETTTTTKLCYPHSFLLVPALYILSPGPLRGPITFNLGLDTCTISRPFFPALIPVRLPLPSHPHSPPASSPFTVLFLSLLGLERGRSHSISPSVSQEPEIPARDAIWYKSIIMKVQHGAKWVSTSAARGANDKTASLCSLACR